MLGKKLYRTSMPNIFRLVIMAVMIAFINDFYLQTLTYENYRSVGSFRFLDVLQYHMMYPVGAIMFFCLIILPAFYYTLIRGTRFHEKGFVVNRGVPFLNKVFLYEEIKSYKLIHPKKAISVHRRKGPVFLIADNDIERVIAILDQHNIPGDLTQDEYVKLALSYKRFFAIIVGSIIFMFFLKKFGIFHLF
jgi:hypothetical protein